MKTLHFAKTAVVVVALMMASCHTSKKATQVEQSQVEMTPDQQELLKRVESQNQKEVTFFNSKLKFSVAVGDQQISLTGNLHMKRDDVIRLQLMAFGFVEAARMEFTQDYVLIMDRINKQYLKAPYYYIDFLRNSGINFYTLQAMFWNELFIPGKEYVKAKELDNFTTDFGGDEAVVYLDRGNLAYSWLVNQESHRIKMANITYRNPYSGNTMLTWDYLGYGILNGKLFPDDMKVTLTTPKQEVKLSIKLNYLKVDDQWELRTTVSDKYRQVKIDELLGRIMSSF